MTSILASLAGLGPFALYFVVSLLLLIVFKYVYTTITPHDEWQLVKEQHNTAAALGLGGAIVGFALALGSAAQHSVSLVDFVIWGVAALLAQCLAFALVRFILMPRIVAQITANEVPAGIILGAVSIAVGVLNAACITY